MKQRIEDRFHNVISQAVLWAAIGCWTIEAAMNARFGWSTGGIGLAAAFVAAAVFAAYFPILLASLKGAPGDPVLWLKRAAILPFLVLCVGLSQVAGWFNLGTLLADSAAKRETLATSRDAALQSLEQMRAERAALGTPRPVTAIAAQLALEKSKKSRAYPDGMGPAATGLAAELAAAERAVVLDAAIPAAVRALEGKDQIAQGRPDLDVLVAITSASASDVAFWVPVGVTAIIGLLANFGLLLAGVGRQRAPERSSNDPLADAWEMQWGPRRVGYAGAADTPAARRPAAPNNGLPKPGCRDGQSPCGECHLQPGETCDVCGAHEAAEHPDYGRARDVQHAHHTASGAGGRLPAGQSPAPTIQHGAPITLNLYGAADSAPRQTAASDAMQALPAGGSTAPVGGGHVDGAGYQAPDDAGGRHAGGVSPASPTVTGAPVDRSHVNRISDQLLLFKAAAVLPAEPHDWVTAEDLYARYVSWATAAVISRPMFIALFGELTQTPHGLEGGEPVFYGIALRGAPQLRIADAG